MYIRIHVRYNIVKKTSVLTTTDEANGSVRFCHTRFRTSARRSRPVNALVGRKTDALPTRIIIIIIIIILTLSPRATTMSFRFSRDPIPVARTRAFCDSCFSFSKFENCRPPPSPDESTVIILFLCGGVFIDVFGGTWCKLRITLKKN